MAHLVEHDPARAAAAHGDVARRVGHEAVVLEGRGAEDTDRTRAEGRDVERGSVGRDGQAVRDREALLLDARGARNHAVVDVLVQVARNDGGAVEDRDARLVQVATHRASTEGARSLEAHFVPRVAPRIPDRQGDRTEQGRARRVGATPRM